MTHDPYDSENRTTAGPSTPEDRDDIYVNRPYGSSYGGSGIAFVIFGVVAVLLIGFAMFGGYPDTDTATTPQTTTEQVPQVQPEQPTAPQPAPSTEGTSGTTTNQ
jgi:hypothetical protein